MAGAALMILALTGTLASAGTVKVLVIGSSQALKPAVEAAFPANGVASHLQQILSADPALSGETITVTARDIFQSKDYTEPTYGVSTTLFSRTLMSWVYWPPSRSDTLALLGQGWDYVVMIDDPYVASQFPEYSFEGLRAIAKEVRKTNGRPMLVMTWSSRSTPLAAFGENTYRAGDAAGVPVVPAGYAWNNLAAGLKGTGTRPNMQGAYTTAAAIYSKMYGRSAATTDYIPAGMTATDRDSIAAAALSNVQADASTPRYSGTRIGPTHFAAPLFQKRRLNYTFFNSSTEVGIRGGLSTSISTARMTQDYTLPTGYQTFITTGFPYDFCSQRIVANTDPTRWKTFGAFDYQDDGGAESMVAGVDRVMYVDPLPEQQTSAADVTPSHIERGAFFVPVRVLWTRLSTERPDIAPQPDNHHMSGEYNQAVGSAMFTLLTGRCGVGSEPADTTTATWRNWYCRKVGYEVAWQYATLRERVPGFEVLPANTTTISLFPGGTTTLTARFLYPPTGNVTVSVSVDDPIAASLNATMLTFTPQNYNVAQTVRVTALASTQSWRPYSVRFATTSSDAVFNGLGDQWTYGTALTANGTWAADASGMWSTMTNWTANAVANGANSTASFHTLDITADRTVSMDMPVTLNRLSFGDLSPQSAGGWTVNPNGNFDNILTMAGTNPVITVGALAADRTVRIESVIAGAARITKDGPGTLVLTAANTFSGGVTIANGTLQVGSGSAVGGIGTGTVTNNGSLIYTFDSTSTLPLRSITGSGNLSVTARAMQLNADISLGGAVVFSQVGGGTASTGLEIVGTSANITGSSIQVSADVGKRIAGGTLLLNTSAANGPMTLNLSLGRTGVWTPLADFTANAGLGTINVTGSGPASSGWGAAPVTLVGAVNISAAVRSDAAVTVNSTADGTIGGVLSGNMSLTKLGTARLTLTGNKTYTGTTTISAGTLALGNGTANGAITGAINNNGILEFNNATPQVFGGAIAGNGTLVKSGRGLLTLNGTNTFTGGTTVSSGTLEIRSAFLPNGGDVSLASGGNLTLSFNGTDVVRSLILDGVAQASGVWGSLSFTAIYKTSSLSGNGTLTVTTGPSQLPYASFAARYNLYALPLAQSGFTGDPDQDGVVNLLEWILGGNPSASDAGSILPKSGGDGVSFTFGFSRNVASLSGTTLIVDWSRDLVNWTPVRIGETSSGPDVNGARVNITPGGTGPDQVVVSFPVGSPATNRMFFRLRASVP